MNKQNKTKPGENGDKYKDIGKTYKHEKIVYPWDPYATQEAKAKAYDWLFPRAMALSILVDTEWEKRKMHRSQCTNNPAITEVLEEFQTVMQVEWQDGGYVQYSIRRGENFDSRAHALASSMVYAGLGSAGPASTWTAGGLPEYKLVVLRREGVLNE